MSRVLLLDADHEHADGVARALRVISCRTEICSDLPSAISALQRQSIDAVVIATFSGPDWERPAEIIRHEALKAIQKPQVICLLRNAYRGPAERVYAARKGFKVIYEG